MLDVLWSVASYERLVVDWDLDPKDAITGATWVIGLVEDAIRDGRSPAHRRRPNGEPMSTTDFDSVDYFRTPAIYQDPYPYYEYVRAHGPVWREPHWGVVMITGFDEVMQVYNDAATFSSCNTVAGPFVKFPVELEGDDISAIIDLHRDTLPFSDQLPSFDPPKHTEQRGLLLRLITPKRLKENEEFMWQLADRTIDEFVARGECEFVHDYAKPVHALGDRRSARRSRSRPRDVPRRSCRATTARPGNPAAARWRTSRWSSSTTGSPRTSRSSGANRATT